MIKKAQVGYCYFSFQVLLLIFVSPTQLSKAVDSVKVRSNVVGIEESRPEPSYSTELVFSEKLSGTMFADTSFRISAKNNNQRPIVSEMMSSSGPWVFVHLRPGQYHISANRSGGRAQSAKFNVVGMRQSKVVLSW